VHRAAELHLLDASLIPPQRRGARRLRTAAQTLQHDEPQITRSEMEERFLELVARAGLPRPLTNHRVEGLTVDAYWPDQHLVVELDSRRWHLLDPRAFEDDRRRDVVLRRAGYEVVRFTWRQVTQERGYVVETLRAYLP
jgi:very-short-patch-repair endonuclease